MVRLFQDIPGDTRLRVVAPGEPIRATSDRPQRIELLVDNTQNGRFMRVRAHSPVPWLQPEEREFIVVSPISEARLGLLVRPPGTAAIPGEEAAGVSLKVYVEMAADPDLAAATFLAAKPPALEHVEALAWIAEDKPRHVDLPKLTIQTGHLLALNSLITEGEQRGRTIEHTEINLGRIETHQCRSATFQLSNKGDAEARIVGCHIGPTTSENSAVVRLQETHIPSNASTTLRLAVTADAFEPGTMQGHVIVELESAPPFEVPVRFHIPKLERQPGAVAIDFGTTNSCVAYARSIGEACALHDREQPPYFPSCLYFHDSDIWDFGAHAKKNIEAYPSNGVQGIKRALRRSTVTIHHRNYKTTDLVRMFISELLALAYANIGGHTEHIALTVPVAFTGHSRQLLEEAVGQAAPECLGKIITYDEPSAAAMYYYSRHYQELLASTQNMLVYDFGGGTLDVAVLEVTPNELKIRSRRGNRRLGGMDIDFLVAQEFLKALSHHDTLKAFDQHILTPSYSDFFRRFGNHMKGRDAARVAILAQAEACKRALATAPTGSYELPQGALLNSHGERIAYANESFKGEIKKKDFELALVKVVEDSRRLIKNALGAAGLRHEDIATVLMTGQVSKLGYLQCEIKKLFPGQTEFPLLQDFELKSCVSIGAAEMLLKLGGGGNSQLDCQVGDLGYFPRGLQPQFEVLIPEGHPFSRKSSINLHVSLDERGIGVCPIYVNQGRERRLELARDDFECVAEIKVSNPALRGTNACLTLMLDKHGLVAIADGPEGCEVHHFDEQEREH